MGHVPSQATQTFADELRRLWNLDGQCQRTAIFLLCAGDRKLYYSGEQNTGIGESCLFCLMEDNGFFRPGRISSCRLCAGNSTALGFVHCLFNLLNTPFPGQYTTAMGNIFKELGKKSNPLATPLPPSTRVASAVPVLLACLVPLFLL